MVDSFLELPPSNGTFTPGTPSGLTPNTRSEAEVAFTLNSVTQTDSAAPASSSPSSEYVEENMTEAQKAWRRPAGIMRTSSTNYEQALQKAHKGSSISSVRSNDSVPDTTTITDGTVTSLTSTTIAAFPPPGQGVVPVLPHTGVASVQAEAIKRAKPSGLSLGALGRQQSWNAQDFKHVHSANLMEPIKDQGYVSVTEGKGEDN